MSRNSNELVVVYIWKGTETQCGHASLQTYSSDGSTSDGGGIYASFWPQDGVDWDGMKTFTAHHEGVLGTVHEDFTTDKEYEAEGLEVVGKKRAAGQPDLEIKLYGLDVRAINAAFNQFKDSKCNWSIFGSTFFRKEKTRNCSGLVSYLLYVGGIAAKQSSYASVLRKSLAALAGVAAFIGVFNSENKELKGEAKFMLSLVYSGIACTAGGLVGGAVGGVADAVSDVAKINEAITSIAHCYRSKDTSFLAEAAIGTLKFLLYPTGIIINSISGAVFIDHPMQSLLMTPNHVADLAASAVETSDDIAYPRAMKFSGGS